MVRSKPSMYIINTCVINTCVVNTCVINTRVNKHSCYKHLKFVYYVDWAGGGGEVFFLCFS